MDGLPGDTHGEWKKVSWEGVLDLPSRKGDYVCMLAAAAEKPDEAWIDVRSLRLEGPVKPGYDGKKQMSLKPFPLRVTPVDPLLSELRPECAEMLFYCAAASDEMRTGERKLLRATAAGKTVTVPFGADGHAKAVFGPIAFSAASRSPNGTMSKPGAGSPKPSRYFSLPAAAMVASVRPWKAPLKVTMRHFSGWPLAKW